MATREIEEWSQTDASNNFPAEEGGWAEGMKRSDVNNAARADMGAMRRWYEDPEFTNTTLSATATKLNFEILRIIGDFTGTPYFKKGARIKIVGGTQDPVFASLQVDAGFAGGATVMLLESFEGHTEVPDNPSHLLTFFAPSIDGQAHLDPIMLTVTTFTDVGLKVAIDQLEALNGGIIALEPRTTYVISKTVKIGTGLSNGNIRILGRGAILQADASLDGDEIMEINDGAAGVIDANVILEDLIFDGNSSAMTAASTGVPLLRIGANVSFVWIRDTLFKDSFGHLVDIINGCRKIWFDGVAFKDAGENGIEMNDSSNLIDQIHINSCTFDTVANTPAILDGSGIHFAGKVHISGCDFINLNAASTNEIGIHARVKGSASPSDESGRQSTISDCRFEGTGTNARGIFLQGRDVLISTCTFNLTGSGTEGIFAEGAANGTERHIITGCSFTGINRGVRFQTSAEDCIVQGCIFENCDFPYTDAGDRDRFIANNLFNGIDGISIFSPAADAVVSNNSIDTMSDDAIVVAAGCNRAQLLHNYVTNITGDDFQADSGTSTNVLETTPTVIFGPMTTNSGAIFQSSTELFYTNSDTITFAGQPLADGVRIWLLDGVISWDLGTSSPTENQIFHWFIKLGRDTGTPTNDGEIYKIPFQIYDPLSSDQGCLSFSGVEFVPDKDADDLYITCTRVVGGTDLFLELVSNAGPDTRFTYLSVRPK